jgi:hypothetical protein
MMTMSDEYLTYTQLVIRLQMAHDGYDTPTEEEVLDELESLPDDEKVRLFDQALQRDGHDEPTMFDLELVAFTPEE